MVTNANTMSDRGRALMRTFAAALEAAKEHAKKHPHETQAIHEALAAHLRSAAPLSMLSPIPNTGPMPRLDPAELVTPSGGMSVQLEDGSWYELIRITDNGASAIRFYVREASGHDVALVLKPARAEELRMNLVRVLAATGARR